MYWAVCGYHHAWNQARGEPQHDACDVEGAMRGELLEVIKVLWGPILW